jgi:uncharacterized surface protein with fasciclin (FAS1) repeats
MRKSALAIGVAAAVLAIGACGKEQVSPGGNGATTSAEGGEAGGKTIAAGIGENSRFAAAAKAAGLDATLAGPGPYTVLVPADEAFNKLPNGQYDSWTKPEGRAQLTGVLTYHILPGTVLAEDIGKAIDNAKGKAVLATMGGGTLTATRSSSSSSSRPANPGAHAPTTAGFPCRRDCLICAQSATGKAVNARYNEGHAWRMGQVNESND